MSNGKKERRVNRKEKSRKKEENKKVRKWCSGRKEGGRKGKNKVRKCK